MNVASQMHTEDYLKDSEQKLQVALQMTGLLIFHQDDCLRYTWIANPKLGATETDLLGRTDEEIMGPEAAAPLIEVKRRALERGTNETAELFVANNGHSGWFELYVQPRRDAAGKVIGILCAARDITARKTIEEEQKLNFERMEQLVAERTDELQRQKERLDLALLGANLGTWDGNYVTGVVHYDERWCQLLGLNQDEITPDFNGWFDRVHPDDKKAVLEATHAHDQGETASYDQEYRSKHKDGHWIWQRSIGKIVLRDESGKPLRITGITQDITARKRIERTGADLICRIESLIHEAVGRPSPAANVNDMEPSAIDSLPRRQRQILPLIAQGLTSAEIAKRLGIGTSSVVSHRRTLMARLNLHNKAELIRFALMHGLVKS